MIDELEALRELRPLPPSDKIIGEVTAAVAATTAVASPTPTTAPTPPTRIKPAGRVERLDLTVSAAELAPTTPHSTGGRARRRVGYLVALAAVAVLIAGIIAISNLGNDDAARVDLSPKGPGVSTTTTASGGAPGTAAPTLAGLATVAAQQPALARSGLEYVTTRDWALGFSVQASTSTAVPADELTSVTTNWIAADGSGFDWVRPDGQAAPPADLSGARAIDQPFGPSWAELDAAPTDPAQLATWLSSMVIQYGDFGLEAPENAVFLLARPATSPALRAQLFDYLAGLDGANLSSAPAELGPDVVQIDIPSTSERTTGWVLHLDVDTTTSAIRQVSVDTDEGPLWRRTFVDSGFVTPN